FPNKPMQILDELLAFVALGTVADIVPLLDENRILVKYGLESLNKTLNIGLKKLIEISALKDKKITAEHISFWLAPRLNATGRMANASMSLELLLTHDSDRAKEITDELNRLNIERQKLMEKTLNHAIELVNKHIDLKNEPLIVLAWQDWHPGIIGLVASKLVEKYGRPAIIISIEGESGKGSGRSIKNVDLFRIISTCENLLIKAGGHHQAVGLHIHKDNIKKFRKEVNSIMKSIITWDEIQPYIDIDSILLPEEINFNLIQELEKFNPFGLGNPRPIFALKEASLKSTPKILKDKHLKFQICKNGIVLDAIGFNQAEKISILQKDNVNIAFNLDINNWQGLESISLQIKDLG
ncbi:single-stranded-DNA-specific exonuclease RecJ, partial [Candidatus Poribacteria bacterium]|nr:single-stranded-DNA-specific exonuclease RecJ [Candidatus Poribacteria bacterium]